MRSPVATVSPDVPVQDAAALMRARRIRHLPVVDGGGRPLGIVTDRDLGQVIFNPALQECLGAGGEAVADIAIRDAMTWAVITVTPSTDIRGAARLMHEQKIGALPVTADGRLVGILTESDVLTTLEEILKFQLTTVRPLLDATPGGSYDYGFPEPGGGDVEPETRTAGNPTPAAPVPPPNTCP